MSDRCHLEFRDVGVYNLLYDIPPLILLMAEAEYYINQINEGKIPTEPYDLVRFSGNALADGPEFENDMLMF
jgi:hypothetical protein